ncbi:hypothetical protein DPMN_193205 [Dreissena polymorpha]|uniref:Uncharacterized protein n=1 Tax=Dreissena polymorpha TaxID=45954 RepID=A0A9D3Y6Q3_DREPO|nr:hypothetical protein DPMN_193205 [Dreissena polymorpha]
MDQAVHGLVISDAHSVEKVKLLTDTNKAKLIRLFRKDLCFQFPSITRLVEKLQKMTTTRQHMLKNPQELVGFLAERKRVSAQRPPTQPHSRGVNMMPNPHSHGVTMMQVEPRSHSMLIGNRL